MQRKRSNQPYKGKPPLHVKGEVQVEVSAGGIVFKRTARGVRIAFILDPFGKWAFAKGHVEQGESIVQAAIRETNEEMGIHDLTVIAPLGTIDFWFRDRYRKEHKGVMIHKYVHYFLMEAPAHVKGRPQRKEKIRKIIWVGLRRLTHTSSYDDVRPILDKVMEYFSGERVRDDALVAGTGLPQQTDMMPPPRESRPHLARPIPIDPRQHPRGPQPIRVVRPPAPNNPDDLGEPLQL